MFTLIKLLLLVFWLYTGIRSLLRDNGSYNLWISLVIIGLGPINWIFDW